MGIRTGLGGGTGPEIAPNHNPVVRGATPLLVVLVLVEATDVVLAAGCILASTRNTFVVFTSKVFALKVFALLGLRAMYFALASLMRLFHYLSYGLALIMAFIGSKIRLEHVLPLGMPLLLGIVGTVLLLSMGASLLWPKPR